MIELLAAPPPLILPPALDLARPAVVRPLERGIWADVDAKMRRLGVPRRVRHAVLTEMKRLAGGDRGQQGLAGADFAKWAGEPQLASIFLLNPFTFPGDPLWSSVVFLSGYEGANGGTTFVDESSFARAVSQYRNAQTSTAQFKFGSSSALFAGGPGFAMDSLTIPVTSRIIPATAAFCVESFVRPANSFGGVQYIVGQWSTVPNLQWVLCLAGGGQQLTWLMSSDGTAQTFIQDAGNMSADTWYHCALDFNGSKYRLFRDGVMVGSNSTPQTIASNTARFTIADLATQDSSAFKGYLDETRVTNASRYGSDTSFTPPTAAFPRR